MIERVEKDENGGRRRSASRTNHMAPSEAADKDAGGAEDLEEQIEADEEADEDTDDLRRQYLLTRFWQTARGFWIGRGRRLAWTLTVMLVLIVVFNTAASYAMNRWNR